MPIDFSGLVLGPAMSIMARPITVTPLVSQPGQPAYAARGIWESKPIDVQTEEGILSSQIHTLGVRDSEYAVQIKQGDRIEIPEAGSLVRIGVCLVEDGDDDGQGGTVLTMKVVGP